MSSSDEVSGRREAAWQRQWELFHAALELPLSSRQAFLDSACGSEPALRAEVESLLEAHQTSSCLDRSALAGAGLDERHAGTGEGEAAILPGDVLANRFEIVRLFGSGGMGTVYEAFDRELGEPVGLKILQRDITSDDEALERFRREITLARRVTHPNVCRSFDLFRHRADQGGELVFLTMELLNGETLAERLRRTGPFTPAEALPLVKQIAGAIAAAHRAGVVHRDLKSANVMLVEGDHGTRAIVTDFGIATLHRTAGAGAARHTRTGQILGTPAYMAPEQVDGSPVSTAADIYALGLLLYEMVTGTVPFSEGTALSIAARRLSERPPSPRTHRSELPRAWERAILWCLERRPQDRPPDADAVLDALKHRRSATARLSFRAVRQRPAAAAAVIAAASLVLLAGIWLFPPAPNSRTDAMLFAERDWVLVSAFDYGPGLSDLDGTVEVALERELSNSQFVNVVPRERVADALQLMKLPPDTLLRGGVAREVARRDGGIAALVNGRVRRLGSSYLLSAEIIQPVTDRAVAALNEEADREEALLAAVRRLAEQVRTALGEAPAEIRSGREALARVTTPSLRALKLYTEADAVLVAEQRAEVAEELLRQAIQEDPSFASAHMLLAFALRNQGRARDEYLQHARRAFEQSDGTPERERYFIRGGYYSMIGNDVQAATSYRALLRLHPDHYWGANNLANTLLFGLHEFDELPSLAVRRGELRPQSFQDQFRAAYAVAVYGNRPLEAGDLAARAAALLPGDSRDYASTWVRLHPVTMAFLRDGPVAVLEELARVEAGAPPGATAGPDELYQQIAGWHLVLGQLWKAERLLRTGARAGAFQAAFFREDMTALRRLAHRPFSAAPATSRLEPLRAALLARTGQQEAAREILRELEDIAAAPHARGRHPWFTVTPAHVLEMLRGELDAARGRPPQAADRLAQALRRERPMGTAIYFLGTEALADALVATDRSDEAVRVLEEAAAQVGWPTPAAGAYWIRARVRLAELYHSAGQADKARALQAELRRLLAAADPDHPLVVRLEMGGARKVP